MPRIDGLDMQGMPAVDEQLRGVEPTLPAPAARSPTELVTSLLERFEQEELQEGLEGAQQRLGFSATRQQRKNGEALPARRALAQFSGGLLDGGDAVLRLVDSAALSGDVDDLIEQLRDAGTPPGVMALVLSVLAARAHSASRRKRIEDALEALLAENEEWALDVFTSMEFGRASADPALRQNLKTLYQEACAESKRTLGEWLENLRTSRDRQRKIKVLIRTLGADLSGPKAVKERERLEATIKHLKRLLIFLGMQEQCARIAASLGTPQIEPDAVLDQLLWLVDQSWLYAEGVSDRMAEAGMMQGQIASCAGKLRQLLRLVPDACFREEDQRGQIDEVLLELVQ